MNKKNIYLIFILNIWLIFPVNTTALEINDSVIIPQFKHTLTVDARGGRIVSEPNKIDCDNTICNYVFVKNFYVALAAVPAQGYDQIESFQSWSGDCSSNNEACLIQMSSDKSVTASFAALGRPVALTTLTVNVGGLGDNVTVVSDPAGINCSANDASCSADFSSDSAVALSATKQDDSNGILSSFFNWTGDCNSSTTACVVNMGEANKTVNANYTALSSVAAFAMAVPVGVNKFYQHPRVEPSVAFVDDIQPFGSGQNGTDLKVKLPAVAGPVDIYLGVAVSGNDDLFLVNSANAFIPISEGLVAWKSAHNGDAIEETIVSNIIWALLPQGTYNFYVMITPVGNTADYYLWQSYRNNSLVVSNPFTN